MVTYPDAITSAEPFESADFFEWVDLTRPEGGTSWSANDLC